MAAGSEKIVTDPDLGQVIFRKNRRCRRISIRIHPMKGVSVSLPYLMPYALAMNFFKIKRQFIIETVERQRVEFKEQLAIAPEAIEAMRQEAKRSLPPKLAELARRYGFTYNKVTIKHNSSNWGSCSAKGNINLNLNIVRLPDLLQEYILIHELCHLRHQNHGQDFHLLQEQLCADIIRAKAADGDRDAMRVCKEAESSLSDCPLSNFLAKEVKKYRLL